LGPTSGLLAYGVLTFLASDTVLIIEPAADASPSIVLPGAGIDGMLGL
jgi:hypothetical protein